jgi:hypothetical protein
MTKHPLEHILLLARKAHGNTIELRQQGDHEHGYTIHYNRLLHWYVIARRDLRPEQPADFYGRRAHALTFLEDNGLRLL